MKKNLKLISTALLGLTWTGALYAGNTIFNFDQDPATDPALSGSIIVGTHNYTAWPGTYNTEQLWCSGGVTNTLTAPTGTNGNPKTGGYLSISDGTNLNNNLVFVFPDIDNGLPVKGFQIDMDMRVGNGSLGRPADGFSVSFARAGDIALVNATNGIVGGFAGGDGSVQVAQSPLGSTDVENGTKTGVAVVFDAWQGNYLPDTPPLSTANPSTDREGIAVRVDDHTLVQLNLQNNRNETDCINASGNTTKQLTLNNDATGLSIQTGTNAPILTSSGGCPLTYGNTDASGSFTNLFWGHLMIRLTNNPNPNLTVTWKGVTVVNTNLSVFAATVGRLVLAGRTGGNNENCHVDNIVVTTIPTTNAFIEGIVGLLNGFILSVSDEGPAIVQRLDKVLLDGSDVTAQTVQAYSAPITTGTYHQATRFAANSFHTVTASWVDNFNNTNSGSIGFVVPNYVYFPTNFVLPLSAVDQTQPGFLVKSYQSFQNSPNQARWNEEQILGLRGNNVVGAGTAPTSGGYFIWDSALGFNNPAGRAPGAGFFPPGTLPTGDADLQAFGIAANYPQDAGLGGQALHDFYDNCLLEIFSYVYFPTSGVYNMIIGSDDSFQVSVSQNAFDRMGNIIWFLNGSRLPNLTTTAANAPNLNDLRTVIIDQPGVYPIRILWDNGGGAAGFEWYTCDTVFSTPFNGAFLVNDTNSFGTTAGTVIQTFRALNGTVDVGPYVKKAIPVRDSQSVVYYQPIIIDLGDGTGSKTVNPSPGTMSLAVDGVPLTFSVNKVGDTTHLIQTGTPSWTATIHTNVLTFQDNLGATYTYSWPFTVLGGATGVPLTDRTNAPNVLTLPLSAKVDPGTLSQPGFNVHTHQMLFRHSGNTGTTEEQLEGLHGPSIAIDQPNTNGPGSYIWPGLLDFRDNAGNSTDVGGEWSYDILMHNAFGFQAEVNNNLVGLSPVNIDNSALEIGAYLVFPSAGTYFLYEQGDDGFKVTVPYGNNLFNKSGLDLGRRDANSNGTSGGINTAGTYVPFNVPAAGAYPFRLIWHNGTGSAMLELSIYQPMPDGSIAKIAVNDTNTPGYIKAYAVSSVPSGPYVSYANPAPFATDITYYQPIIVDITDGASATVDPTKIDSFKEDGNIVTFNATKPAGNVTHIIQTLAAPWEINRNHTNVLVFHDSTSTSYTNTWVFGVMNFSAFTTVAKIPASNSVPVGTLSQPGFRIKSYQTTAGQANTILWTEQQFEGFFGPNIALPDPGALGYYTWNDKIDFNNYPGGGGGGNSGAGEWNYDNLFDLFGCQLNGGGTLKNNFSLNIGTYLNFTKAGDYIMIGNSDDGFRCTSPYGNPFNEAAAIWLGEFNGGRGGAGGGIGPRGGATYFAFNIPTPGAYPFRMLYENGGGGGALEWEIYQFLPNGGVAQMLIGDTNTPGAIQAFQVSSQDTPYVEYISPLPNGVTGTARPAITLSGNAVANTSTNVGPVQQDVVIGLASGTSSSVNTNLPITLSLNGFVQPIIVGNTGTNNWVLIIRSATNSTWWPSGQLGPLLLSFTDSSARQITLNLGTIATPFWGTLSNPLDISRIDTTKPGIKVRTYAVDPLGTTTLDTRVHAAEQVLAGLWGPNTINLANNTNGHPLDAFGYYTYPTANNTFTVVSNGVVNFDYAGPDGNFQPAGFPEVRWPGIPNNNTVGNKTDNFMAEILALVEFPTNGNYTLGVSSDDGFRVTRGWNRPANNGAMVVNSPAGVAGPKATLTDSSYASTLLTTPITANLALAQGIGVEYGSTTNGEGCVINNDLTGKIALIYRSAFCGYAQQVVNAFNAHALAVVFVQNPAANGFPQEPGVTPPVGIPAVEVTAAVGSTLGGILATGGVVNVTLSGMDYVVNPPPGQGPLGQADIGKGASDILFPVAVQQAGVYPLRLVWFQGGGGANCEFFTANGNWNSPTNHVLINDLTKVTGPGPGGSGLRAWYGGPVLSIVNNQNGTVTLTFTGYLQVRPDLATPWADYSGNPASPLTIPANAMQFFRSRY